MMEWTDALRKYAEIHGKKFRIYKKGTAEYDAVKALQQKGKGALTKKERSKILKQMDAPKRTVKMTEDGGMKITVGKGRKPRSDIGKKRITTKQIVDESVRQGLVSKAVAYGRKVRKDKGVKRGPRKAKAAGESKPPVVQFDEEGNML